MGQLEPYKQSFWKRPEGVTGALLIALALYGVFKLTVFLAPLLVTAAAVTTATLGVLSIVGGALNRKTRTVGLNIFKLGSYWITRSLIPMDPISILQAIVADGKKRLQKVWKGISRIQGVRRLIVSKLEKNVKDEKQFIKDGQVAFERGDTLRASALGRRAMILEKQRVEYTTLLQRIDGNLKSLMQLYRVVELKVEDGEFEVKTLKDSWEVTKETRSISREMSALISGLTESDLYERTAGYVREQGFLADADIELLAELTQGLYLSVEAQDALGLANITTRIEEENRRALGTASPKVVAKIEAEAEEVEEPTYPGQDFAFEAELAQFFSEHQKV